MEDSCAACGYENGYLTQFVYWLFSRGLRITRDLTTGAVAITVESIAKQFAFYDLVSSGEGGKDREICRVSHIIHLSQ